MLSLQQPLLVHAETLQRLKVFNERLQKYCKDTFQQEDSVFCVHDIKRKHFHAFNINHPMAFSEKHSLVYFAKQHPQGFSIQDPAITEHIPEVMLLDIQLLLQQYQFTFVLPLNAANRIYGFVFLKTAPTINDLETKLFEFSKKFGYGLEEIMRYDTVVLAPQYLESVVKANIFQKVLLAYLVFLIVFWGIINYLGFKTSIYNHLYTFLYCLIPLFGGLLIMGVYRKWRYEKNYLNRALFFFGAGIFLWGAGSMVWVYYIFFTGVEVPYPSLADIGYMVSYPGLIVASYYLMKSNYLKIKNKDDNTKVFCYIFFPVIVAIFSYHFLFVVYKQSLFFHETGNFLKPFFDIYYMFSDLIMISLNIVTFSFSYHFFEGFYQKSFYKIILGIMILYVADLSFSYTTTIQTFYNGNYNDLLYTLAFFIIVYGCFGFYNVGSKFKQVERELVK